MELECWDESFHSIFLHSSLEHLSYDSKNIKELMIHMAKYIENKNIDTAKSNDVPELKSVGEST